MAGAGTAHLCSRCPSLLSSLPRAARIHHRARSLLHLTQPQFLRDPSSISSSSSASSSVPALSVSRHVAGPGGSRRDAYSSGSLSFAAVSCGRQLLRVSQLKRFNRVDVESCSRRELSVRAKVVETDAVVEESSTEEAATATTSSPSVSKFKKRLRIAEIKGGDDGGLGRVGETMVVRGWVRTCRLQKTFTFIEVNDGSAVSNLQAVVGSDADGYDKIEAGLVNTGASVAIEGVLVESQGSKQKVELKASKITLVGGTDAATFPIQKKKLTREYLRSIAHLRPRTNTFGAVARVRNALAFATHQFFNEQGFVWVASPIITASDCEGAGEQFCVTTLIPNSHEDPSTPLTEIPSTKEGLIDWSQDFFGRPAFLTVSGQLNAEIYATALCDYLRTKVTKNANSWAAQELCFIRNALFMEQQRRASGELFVYTFGPTFRAENSHTTRHLAEFWMIEPELAFADLKDDMACATAYLKYVVRYILENCKEDMEFFNQWVEKGITTRLTNVVEKDFVHVTYTDAVALLQKAKKKFEFPVKWGCDLQSEHERYLTEEAFSGNPVIVTDYPKDIKAFYMRENEDCKTVAAMDVLVPRKMPIEETLDLAFTGPKDLNPWLPPLCVEILAPLLVSTHLRGILGVGELIGGSQREERLEVLERRIDELGLNKDSYWWYLDLRRYGSVPHAGFGLGFERLVQFATGVENIRDVIPFPRTPGSAEF